VIPFSYHDLTVRTKVNDEGEPMFCLADVAKVLNLRNSKDFTKSDWCDGDGVEIFSLTDSLGREQEATFISEPNLYALVMRSTKPEAKAFSRWVTHEVLPQIRKAGSYSVAKSDDPFLTMLDGVKTLYIQQQEMDRRLTNVENRIDAAAKSVKSLPPAEEVRELSTRENCRQAINELSTLTGLSHHECWSRAYAEYDMLTHSKVTVLANNRKMGKLDYIDRHGKIDTLYGLIRRKIERAAVAS